MNELKFKVGDMVINRSKHWGKLNDTGKIVEIDKTDDKYDPPYRVEFVLINTVKYFWLFENEIELINE